MHNIIGIRKNIKQLLQIINNIVWFFVDSWILCSFCSVALFINQKNKLLVHVLRDIHRWWTPLCWLFHLFVNLSAVIFFFQDQRHHSSWNCIWASLVHKILVWCSRFLGQDRRHSDSFYPQARIVASCERWRRLDSSSSPMELLPKCSYIQL